MFGFSYFVWEHSNLCQVFVCHLEFETLFFYIVLNPDCLEHEDRFFFLGKYVGKKFSRIRCFSLFSLHFP